MLFDRVFKRRLSISFLFPRFLGTDGIRHHSKTNPTARKGWMINRMTSYVYQAKPRTEEMLIDEMLAICAEIDAWKAKKVGEEAQAKYNAYLFNRR